MYKMLTYLIEMNNKMVLAIKNCFYLNLSNFKQRRAKNKQFQGQK